MSRKEHTRCERVATLGLLSYASALVSAIGVDASTGSPPGKETAAILAEINDDVAEAVQTGTWLLDAAVTVALPHTQSSIDEVMDLQMDKHISATEISLSSIAKTLTEPRVDDLTKDEPSRHERAAVVGGLGSFKTVLTRFYQNQQLLTAAAHRTQSTHKRKGSFSRNSGSESSQTSVASRRNNNGGHQRDQQQRSDTTSQSTADGKRRNRGRNQRHRPNSNGGNGANNRKR